MCRSSREQTKAGTWNVCSRRGVLVLIRHIKRDWREPLNTLECLQFESSPANRWHLNCIAVRSPAGLASAEMGIWTEARRPCCATTLLDQARTSSVSSKVESKVAEEEHTARRCRAGNCLISGPCRRGRRAGCTQKIEGLRKPRPSCRSELRVQRRRTGSTRERTVHGVFLAWFVAILRLSLLARYMHTP